MVDKLDKTEELSEYWVLESGKPDKLGLWCAGNGIFINKKTKIFEAMVKLDMPDIEEGVKLTIPKIPYKIFENIVCFFRAVHQKYDAEAIVLLLYDYDKKMWGFHIPKQEVSGASADYDLKEEPIETKNIVGTIHSHNTMSAFHSGTDDHDEEGQDGIHMTVGKLDSYPVEVACSIMVHGTRVKVDLKDIVGSETFAVPDKVSKKEYKSWYEQHKDDKDDYGQGWVFENGAWINKACQRSLGDTGDEWADFYSKFKRKGKKWTKV